MTGVSRLIDLPWRRPSLLDTLIRDAERHGCTLRREDRTGALLATMAASKPGGRFLALGSGIGPAATWLLDGMNDDASLIVVEEDSAIYDICRWRLSGDPRVHLVPGPISEWLPNSRGSLFDLAYIDCENGTFEHQDDVVELLGRGALYIAGNLMPDFDVATTQAHSAEDFLDRLPATPHLRSVFMRWSSGLVVAARI
jgi:predicted O-methyltransferase YrrM